MSTRHVPRSSGPKGLLIAAPASGHGKTTVTLGLLRALARRGCRVSGIKTGPDYIDPAFHAAASGRPCFNLDPWAMRPGTMARILARSQDCDIVVGEGVMGLFDGAAGGAGSTAELAAHLGWPVVLVVDAKGMAQSAAALLHGFATYRPELAVAGVVFNRVGSPRHGERLREAAEAVGMPVLGLLPHVGALALPSRHLGLVQAGEHTSLQAFLEAAADRIDRHLDIDRLLALAAPATPPVPPLTGTAIPLLGQRIAVARDEAFAFAYPALLTDWREAGSEIRPFSPLADEAPDPAADAIYLPGGYPELHAGRLSGNRGFLDGLRKAAAGGAWIYGECGGYMVLGKGMVDAAGERHAMAELLSVETSFADQQLHLGYRSAALLGDTALGSAGTGFRGHEFHYASTLSVEAGSAFCAATDAAGCALGPTGEICGKVFGSFLHLIDSDQNKTYD